MSSASATTWPGLRRSMPTMCSRCSQSALSAIAAKRRAASRGKRVVIVVWAPSRSRRSAMYIPIFARPPVSSARRPRRSVRASRRAWLRAAQVAAELVVERVDLDVALLADVARRGWTSVPAVAPLACEGAAAGRRSRRRCGPRAGGRRGGHGGVGGEHRGAPLGAAAQLDVLKGRRWRGGRRPRRGARWGARRAA